MKIKKNSTDYEVGYGATIETDKGVTKYFYYLDFEWK
jgi:hypothetical protein